MRSMVEGFFLRPKNPSTALRAVPLPRKAGEEYQRLSLKKALSISPDSASPMPG